MIELASVWIRIREEFKQKLGDTVRVCRLQVAQTGVEELWVDSRYSQGLEPRGVGEDVILE